ncbi:pentapeptide repeat-containing protein [Paracraurococcus lichenis]|uniref:Pentapeptide repeat-containing protein n=1 Tax=Paracraurococcus lichenis TaxID=3064888 RepID=A0ABT9EDC3_9PROT|nr:pentapeptide repeat-containing protein [Paracraurococcus sp. LOR1-02]MDO9714220.1 pentapeptide repeat-containing protein [Paracraurococcus sp. LOR1-02]
MANADHLDLLRQGVEAWNAWREKEPSVRPDLSGTDLSFKNFRKANFGGVDFRGANLVWVDFSEVDLREANLIEAHLRRADLREADLSRSDLRRANLSVADLRKAKLGSADLKLANLVDARLDRADLTGAKLWETQREGWSIKCVTCQHAFWDREDKDPIVYGEGEFERIFADKPRIVLRYPGGMSPVDLLALPLIVERLQAEHPGSVLQVRSVQNEAGAASVTITVEDLEGRSAEAFGQELMRLQIELKCIANERDRLDSILREGIFRMASALAQPRQRQEIHVHGPSAIEGPTMSRDTYNVSGQAGAVAPRAHAHDNTFQQVQGGVDLAKLAEELGRLRAAMKGEATGTREQDKAIGAVADAEEAAAKGDGQAALGYLKSAGKWALGVAEKIGVAVATEALKRAM